MHRFYDAVSYMSLLDQLEYTPLEMVLEIMFTCPALTIILSVD